MLVARYYKQWMSITDSIQCTNYQLVNYDIIIDNSIDQF